jgi:hypothetical protein
LWFCSLARSSFNPEIVRDYPALEPVKRIAGAPGIEIHELLEPAYFIRTVKSLYPQNISFTGIEK